MTWWTGWCAYLVLQGACCGLLVVVFALGYALKPILSEAANGFLRSWLASFVLVPITYILVLVVWHPWVLRRFGRHPRLYRLFAEVAFAVEVVGSLLYQRIA